MMKLTLKTQNPGDIPADLLAIPVFSAAKPNSSKNAKKSGAESRPALPRAVAALDKALGGAGQGGPGE